MAATTIPISTDERLGEIDYYPVAAATKIPAGVIVALNAAGNAVNASDAAALRVIGRAEETVDNTAGAAGDLFINVKRGVFKWANSGTNAIASPTHLRKFAYVEDNQTVATTSTNKIIAGRIRSVDADGGVWVDTRLSALAAAVTDGTTNGAASGAADLAALKTETEAIGDAFRDLLSKLA